MVKDLINRVFLQFYFFIFHDTIFVGESIMSILFCGLKVGRRAGKDCDKKE